LKAVDASELLVCGWMGDERHVWEMQIVGDCAQLNCLVYFRYSMEEFIGVDGQLKRLRTALDAIICKLPVARKAQLVELALSHIAEVSYFRLERQGFRPKGIIDIGAYQGDWTRLIAKFFPRVPILMIEAQAEKKPFLDSVRTELPRVDYLLCLLGDNDGSQVIFNIMETGSSIYSERSNMLRTQRRLSMRTLDGVLKEYPQLKEPLFIKLDVQGAELDVLRGGRNALRAAEVIQMEVALMPYNEGAPLATTVFNFMAELNFVVFDICGFVRPTPPHLAQIDVLFVRADSTLRNDYFVF
jgi:FkbM family methyltransferase